MAQPNVAREPSMEEILASIRKIIESNEPGAGKSISPSLPPVYAVSDDDGDDIHLTVEDDLDSVEFDDVPPVPAAPEPRFVAANSAGPAHAPEAPVRTMSLADVAARVRAASERSAVQQGPVREVPPPRELPSAMAARFAEIRLETVAPQPLLSVVTENASSLAIVASTAVVPSPETAEFDHPAEPLHEEEPMAAPVVEAMAPLPEQPAAAREEERSLQQVQAEVQPALLSEAAGEQVARSFDELVAAIDGSNRRSLDEIAQEMLRPMLQEWLDDNLPTLVERLVREEIERVARGPRR